MAPPLIFLTFVVVAALLIAVAAFVATRTGLWVRETSPDAETEAGAPDAARPAADEDEPRFERPQHVAVSDPARQRYIGT
ncbi:MAG: hypothetical protein IRZ32_01085 [Solirubrobacteraceae bacterium]|nr:hypothetical protein [Solirubrobacteraceae bacterium]